MYSQDFVVQHRETYENICLARVLITLFKSLVFELSSLNMSAFNFTIATFYVYEY